MKIIKDHLNFAHLVILLILSSTLTYCSEDNNPVDKDENNDSLNIEGYTLIWNDEFNGSTVNWNKWEPEVNGQGGGNNELQYYTLQEKNAYVKDGRLFITAIKEEFSGTDGTRNYTSARLRTRNLGDWLYGRIEVSAKLPGGIGTWPAIWMLPTDWNYGGWPASGEIDIMEHVGYNPNIIHGSVHTEAYNHKIGTQKSNTIPIPTAQNSFHTYSIDWTENKIDFFVDDIYYFSFENENQGWMKWPFDQRFHLILNIAVGGDWGGVQGIDDNAFPATMEVDYVRVYQKDK